MYPVHLLFSNWILAWWVLYRLKVVKSSPVLGGLLATAFFGVMFYGVIRKKSLFWLLFAVHAVVAVDLLVVQNKSLTKHLRGEGLVQEVTLFMIFNVFILVVYNKTFGQIYFEELPDAYRRHPELTAQTFLQKLVMDLHQHPERYLTPPSTTPVPPTAP